MINYLSPLHAVDLEAWNVPFHGTHKLDHYARKAPKKYFPGTDSGL